MKSFCSSDSLGAFISICPPKEHTDATIVNAEDQKYAGTTNRGYSKEFQAMLDSLDQEDCGEEEFTGKKRRLSSDQVKALERYFEVENKLEPERKAKLADELGLQPRQVAIWFQNRRARWKTKQLEKDYTLLKANYDSLKLSYENLHQQNETLTKKLRQLKAKLGSESSESSQSVKEESPFSGAREHDEKSNNNNISLDNRKHSTIFQENTSEIQKANFLETYGDYTKSSKDGSSEDSDSINGVMKDEDGKPEFSLELKGSSSSSNNNPLMTNWFQLSDYSNSRALFPLKMCQVPQLIMRNMEDHNLFSSEDQSCNFFSVDQAPTLHWYFPEQ